MVFKVLITIVFIAELIITFTILYFLYKFDKRILGIDGTLDAVKPQIKSISELVRKISEQIYELTPVWVNDIKKSLEKILLEQTKSIMTGILFWIINIKVLKQLRQSKIFKTASKGLSLLQNVI